MKKLFFVLALFIPTVIYAQTIKTDVLVLGNGDAAFAAAFQCYKSGVKTILLTQNIGFDAKKIKETKSAEIQKLYLNFTSKEIENLANFNQKKKSKEKKIDSTTLLKVINNMSFREIKRSGSVWELKLTKDKSIKAKVLVVADDSEKTVKALNIQNLKTAELSQINYSENLYRTTISGISGTSKLLSLYDLIIPNQENILYIQPDNVEIGQAAGATASYGAFFETKTSLSNLKRIQGELLAYKLSLMPFEDVKVADSNWLAIQKVGITGILKADISNEKVLFHPEKEVSYNEIKQPIKDYYYKAQIWFDDHQNVPINLENTISMVCYVGNKAVDATKMELEKKWDKNYKFSSKYELKKLLTRREFSVIINEYLMPFDKINVDRTGRVIR